MGCPWDLPIDGSTERGADAFKIASPQCYSLAFLDILILGGLITDSHPSSFVSLGFHRKGRFCADLENIDKQSIHRQTGGAPSAEGITPNLAG